MPLRALALAALLAATPALAAAPESTHQKCAYFVCAEARSAITVACAESRDGADAALRCAFEFVSFTWGKSPLFLPGRVFLFGDAIAQWSCTQGCAPGRVERFVNAYAVWEGGPDALGLEQGDGGDVTVLVQEAELRAPPGSGACLRWDHSLETTAWATVPQLPRGLPSNWLEEVYAGDGALPQGQACLAR